MREAGIELRRRVFQQLRRKGSSVHDERGNIDSLEVFRKVCFREGLDAVILGLDPADLPLPPPVVSDTLRNLRSRTVIAVEGQRDVLVELSAILSCAFANLVEDFFLAGFQPTTLRGLPATMTNREDDKDLLLKASWFLPECRAPSADHCLLPTEDQFCRGYNSLRESGRNCFIAESLRTYWSQSLVAYVGMDVDRLTV